MQSFELLGGKYQQGEQVVPGAIQTFRAYEVPTGRPVFIHRIASNDPAAQEIAGLLSAGLIRSSTVRKMLLDVYESEPYRFVVTEPARQCVPLRDWLEREAGDMPEPAAKPVAALEALSVEPPLKFAPAPSPDPSSAAEVEAIEPPPDAEPSEFTRLFHEALSGKLERSRRSAVPQDPAPLSSVSGKAPLNDGGAAPKPAVREPGPLSRTAERGDAIPDAIKAPLAEQAAIPAPEPKLFSQVAEAQDAGRSRLTIFLVVLGVVVVLLVIFVVVFVKR